MKIDSWCRSIRRKPSPAPLRPPQIPHDLIWDRTRAAAEENRPLTWVTPRPNVRAFIAVCTYYFPLAGVIVSFNNSLLILCYMLFLPYLLPIFFYIRICSFFSTVLACSFRFVLGVHINKLIELKRILKMRRYAFRHALTRRHAPACMHAHIHVKVLLTIL
jgi:hypothetical protein